MYRTVLVPLDGSRFAEHALPLAGALARHAGAKLRVVTVSTPLASFTAEGAYFGTAEMEAELDGRYRAYLNSTAGRLRARGTEVEVDLLHGEVAECICADAERQAELVVMATHGRGTLERFWLGSVADEVVRNVTRPVLLVRPADEEADLGSEPKLSPVVVSLDGTPLAEKVLDHALEMAALAPGAELVLMRAITSVAPVPSHLDVPEAEREARGLMSQVHKLQSHLRREAETYLEGVAARVRQRGVKARTAVVVEDQPAVAILNEARAVGAGLIALETHGRSGLTRFFLGSVADKVIRGATTPVLVHRSPD